MTDSGIDAAAFAELQAQAGADFVVELIDTFADEGPRLLAALRAAVSAGDPVARRRAAHSVKSNAHTFGARALAAQARAIELAAEAPAAAELDALEAAFAHTIAALRRLGAG